MSGVHYVSNHKYIVTQLSQKKFHVGRIRKGDETYECVCTCTDLVIAKFIMEAIARLEEERRWQQ